MGNKVPNWQSSTVVTDVKKNFFEYSAKTIDGVEVPMSKYQGHRALLVVNVASKCGYTNAYYKELGELIEAVKEKEGKGKFEVLGFPCGQFAGQEYSTPEEIKNFVKKFNVDFPLFEKIDVNGPKTHPIFQYLKINSPELCEKKGNSITLRPIGWNFGKFLVDADGYVVKYYGPKTSPKHCREDVFKVISGEIHGNASNLPGSVTISGGDTTTDPVEPGETCSRKD